MRVLIAVDLHHQPEFIVDMGAAWGARFGATVDLIYATNHPNLATWAVNPATQELLRSGVRRLTEDDQLALNHLIRRVPAGHRGEVHLAEGRPSEVIPARGREYDLLIVGTHGREGLRHLLLGSVAERLVRASPKPVLVVRGPPPETPFPILCPVDVRDHHARSLITDLVLPWVDGLGTADLAFVEPVDVPLAAAVLYPSVAMTIVEAREASDAARLVEMQASLPEHLRGKSWFNTGEVAVSLVRASAEHRLAILVTHGRTGVDRWWLGSVAERFVRVAPCSVLVLRRPSDELS